MPEKDSTDELSLFLASPVASIVLDAERLVVLEANDAAAAMLGRTRQDLTGEGALSLVPREHALALTDDGPAREVPLARAGGSIHAGVQSRGARLRGRAVRIVTLEDWTERHRLASEADAYRGVVDLAFDAVLVHQDGVVRFANEAFARISGLRLDEIVGQPVLPLVAPELRDLVQRQTAAGLEGPYESAGYTKDGRRVDVELCVKNVTYAGRPARLTAIRDITERKRKDEALRRSEARFRELIELLPIMVTVHRDGVVLYANPALGRHLGTPPEQLVGTDVLALAHPDERARIRARLARLGIDERQTPVTEVRGTHPDGSIQTIEVMSVALDLDDGPAVFTIARDVTARKELELRLLQADLMASVGRLAAGVAHEINNPLSYLTLHLGLLAREMQGIANASSDAERRRSTSSAERLVAEAQEAAERIAHVVRNFRVFSRADAEPGPVDVVAVLESAIKLGRSEIAARAHVSKTYAADLPPAHGVEPRLGQVFLNVLLNAAQAIAPNEPGEIHVTARREGAEIVVLVEDTGVGIPPEHLGRVFDPFFTTKAPGGGTGLGLWITKGIVEDLGGTIALSNRPGGGATCRITLRATVETAAPSAPAPAPAPVRRARILIVDDEPLLLKSLSAELGADHDVATELRGEAALERLCREDFDVVLCDLMMPKMSGIDLYRALAAARPGHEARLVFMTGGAFTATSREFLAEVKNPRLEKPFDLAELRAVLREIGEATRRDGG